MRTLVSTVFIGVSLMAAPAFAQQHPWVASCVYSSNCGTSWPGSLNNDQATARAHASHRVIRKLAQ